MARHNSKVHLFIRHKDLLATINKDIVLAIRRNSLDRILIPINSNSLRQVTTLLGTPRHKLASTHHTLSSKLRSRVRASLPSKVSITREDHHLVMILVDTANNIHKVIPKNSPIHGRPRMRRRLTRGSIQVWVLTAIDCVILCLMPGKTQVSNTSITSSLCLIVKGELSQDKTVV
jgi:hypothetical protein